jgi:hypothetical protein
MKARKFPIYLSTIALASTVGIGNLSAWTSAAGAQTANANELDRAIQINFDLPPAKGGPEKTAGGGTRGGCESPEVGSNGSSSPTNLTRLALILPKNQTGVTVSERPTFFAYLSETSAQKIEFTLKNQEETYTYRQVLEIGKTPGIISFSLPESAPPLKVGEQYQWSVAAICQPEDRLQDVVAFGQLQRVAPSPQLQQQLTKAESPIEKAQAYADNGIWHETIEIVAKQKRQQPENQALQKAWSHLLQQDTVSLAYIAQQPFVDCCVSPQATQSSSTSEASHDRSQQFSTLGLSSSENESQ